MESEPMLVMDPWPGTGRAGTKAGSFSSRRAALCSATRGVSSGGMTAAACAGGLAGMISGRAQAVRARINRTGASSRMTDSFSQGTRAR